MSYTILKLVCNTNLLIDISFLKESYETGRLQGARVFARLFGIIDDGLFHNQNNN